MLQDEEEDAVYDKGERTMGTVDDYINDIMQMDNVRCQEEEEDEGEGYVSFDEDEPQEYRNGDSVRSKESNSSEGKRDQEQLYYEYVNEDGTKTRLNFNPDSDATEQVPGEVNRDHKIPLKLKRSFTDACKSETIPNNTVNAKEESVFQFSNELVTAGSHHLLILYPSVLLHQKMA